MTFTIEQLWRAYRDCLTQKRNTISALRFEMDRERNLFALLEELQRRTYTVSPHHCFIITEPTPREIFAADFRDRIIHHLLCNEIAPFFEQDFIETSFANRKGKGTHKAVDCLRQEVQKGGFFLKIDIQAFFRSINREILFHLVQEKLHFLQKDESWTADMLWLCHLIISHDPVDRCVFHGDESSRSIIPPSKSLFYAGKKGLPIGNLTSQFFGNVYLNELDHYIHSLGFPHVRYVDDVVLFAYSKALLLAALPKIQGFLEEHLRLTLHPRKIILQDVAKGVDFLGYFVRPSYTLVRRKIVARFKRKIWSKNYSVPMLNSYFGHFRHAASYRLRKSICEQLHEEHSLHSDENHTKFSPLPHAAPAFSIAP